MKRKVPENKVIVCDRVYTDKDGNNNDDLALPCIGDESDLFELKSRLRTRYESLNGRLKDFRILADVFHHPHERHEFAFGAVIVLVQYAMDHGHPIFDAH